MRRSFFLQGEVDVILSRAGSYFRTVAGGYDAIPVFPAEDFVVFPGPFDAPVGAGDAVYLDFVARHRDDVVAGAALEGVL